MLPSRCNDCIKVEKAKDTRNLEAKKRPFPELRKLKR